LALRSVGSAFAQHACVIVVAVALLLGAQPVAEAIVGDARRVAGRAAQSLVVVRVAGGQCTGTVLATQLVLTAAHCVVGDKMRVRAYGDRKLHRVVDAVVHPQYGRLTIETRVDLALLKLATPLPERAKPALLARRSTTAGEAVLVAGYGLDDADAVNVTGRARMATLIALDERLGILLQLRDPASQEAQLGACQGDSGGPAFAIRDDLVVVGVVSAGPERCGGFTFVTPITPYYDWIVETARKLGSAVEH
jgi:hypothetical protein